MSSSDGPRNGGLNLTGKVALVTGSSRGIGLATARTLAAHGSAVILNARSDREAIEREAAKIREDFKVACIGIVADAADPAAVKACYPQIFKEFRRLDVLVNNAGLLQDALLGMMNEQLIRSTFDVNVLGAIYHTQEAARLMARNGSGSIINVSSIMGRYGTEGLSAYVASKAALIGLTMAAAKELAPKKIRVNAVAPGFIKTDLIGSLSEAKYAERLASVKMGRVGEPEDVANAILFLSSDLSTYVTGQVLGVDGGMVV